MCPIPRMLGTLQAAICKSMQMCRSDMQRGIIFNSFQFISIHFNSIIVYICSLLPSTFNQVRFTWLDWPEADSVAFPFVFGVFACSLLLLLLLLCWWRWWRWWWWSLPFSSSSSSASDSRYHAGSDFRWLKAPFAAGALQWYSAIRDYLGQQLVILGSSLPVPASFKIFGKLVQNSTVFQPQRSYSPTG